MRPCVADEYSSRWLEWLWLWCGGEVDCVVRARSGWRWLRGGSDDVEEARGGGKSRKRV